MTLKLPPAAKQVVREFILTAVARKNLTRAYALSGPLIRQGMSLKEWNKGAIPVVPYPADAFARAGWTLKYSTKGVLGYDVLIVPKQTKAGDLAGQQVYACELHDVHGRWLVDYCYPRKTL